LNYGQLYGQTHSLEPVPAWPGLTLITLISDVVSLKNAASFPAAHGHDHTFGHACPPQVASCRAAHVVHQQLWNTSGKDHDGAGHKSSELEKEHGRWIYSFDVATTDGVHEVNVDANTGKVVEDSKETAAQEAREAAQKHKEHQKNQDKTPNPQ
jgi:hypothetical protein